MSNEKIIQSHAKKRISVGPREWPVLANLLKRIQASDQIKLTNQESSIIRLISAQLPPACNEECKDFNERGLPHDFDTRMIAHLTTSPIFAEEDRALILKAVMSYDPPKDRPLQRLTMHVISEFRKLLIAPQMELEEKVQHLSEKIKTLLEEIESKENYSKKLLKEIYFLSESIQSILRESTGKLQNSEARVMDAFNHDIPKEEIIEIIKEQNRKIIEYFKIEAQKANQDALTGLANRGAFDFHLNEFIKECLQNATPLSLMMIDIDHFKRINDTYGHLVGDEALKFVARDGIEHVIHGFSSTIRARYGGEEFAVIMKGVDIRKAASIAEKLRGHLEGKPFKFRSNDQEMEEIITLSIGVAELVSDQEAPQHLLNRVDKALYKAKEAGRNRVCMADM